MKNLYLRQKMNPLQGRSKSGVTLVEMMVTLVIMGIGVVGLMATYGSIQRGIQTSKNRTLASNLCKEKLEVMKNLTYGLLRATTQTDLNLYGYDNTYYPPETDVSAGVTFTRYASVKKIYVDASGTVQDLQATDPDTGGKKIHVWTTWNQDNETKRYEMVSLLNDPSYSGSAGSISGTVYRAPGGVGNELGQATIVVTDNPSWTNLSNSAGSYRIITATGTYTVRASKDGYYPVSATASAAPNATNNFTLAARGVGSVSGVAYVRDHLVISQVVTSTKQAELSDFVAQYIELYNPTTYTFTIGGVSPLIKVNYTVPVGCTNPDRCADANFGIKLNYVNNTIAPNSYYLIANAASFWMNGTLWVADAFFTNDADTFCSTIPNGNLWNLIAVPVRKMILDPGHGGLVWLTNSAGQTIDSFGWIHNGNSTGSCESTCLDLGASGLRDTDQVLRRSSSSSSNFSTYGPAYDANVNSTDFLYSAAPAVPVSPHNTASAALAPLTGTPAVGAVISASDDLSSPITVTSATGYFQLTGIATGTVSGTVSTVRIDASSYSLYGASASVTVPANANVDVGTLILSSAGTTGTITGTVSVSTGGGLNGINVSCGGTTVTTVASGVYQAVISAASGLTCIANPTNPANASTSRYNSASSAGIDLSVGAVVSGVDFILNPSGTITGRVTSDGTNGLENVVVQAAAPAATARGTVATDSSGNFTIPVPISTLAGVGVYTVTTVLDPSQSSTPTSFSANVTQGTNVAVGTFTIAGTLSAISGTVTESGASITTGVLIMASTATIAAGPPTWDETQRNAGILYYSAHSNSDGSYSLPVRVSATQYNIYAWYSKMNAQAATTVRKSATQTVITTATYTSNFTWP